MQIIIPMAGTGERFKKAGYREIKPLIPVDGKPMIERVVALFPGENDFLFICNDEHLQQSKLRAVLKRIKPTGIIASIHKHKLGPVQTIMAAREHIRDNEPVFVNYCDYGMQWDWNNFKKKVSAPNVASAAVCYRGFHPHLLGPNLYAGVRADARLVALEVREKHSFTKDKMKTWQQAGGFYFASGALLKKYAAMLLKSGKKVNGEFYVSMLFNPMIRDGKKSLVYPIERFFQWGTPQDLQVYEYWQSSFKDGSIEA